MAVRRPKRLSSSPQRINPLNGKKKPAKPQGMKGEDGGLMPPVVFLCCGRCGMAAAVLCPLSRADAVRRTLKRLLAEAARSAVGAQRRTASTRPRAHAGHAPPLEANHDDATQQIPLFE
jgi:hypothetical protein